LDDDVRVAVLIPVYNNSKTVLSGLVPQIINSRDHHGRLPMRVILVDSSTDGTAHLLSEALDLEWNEESENWCKARCKNLEFIHLKHRKGGKGWAINEVVKDLDVKYFCILDSDWVLSFKEFGKAVHYLEDNPRYSYAQIAWRAADKQLGLVSGIDQVSIEYRHQFENRVRSWLDVPVTIHGTAVVIRTELFKAMGGFDDTVLSEDVDLALRLILHGKSGISLSDLSMQENPCDHLRQFFFQKARWAEGRSQMLRKYARPILESSYMSKLSKLIWIYYLSYFGRCVGFTVLLALLLVGLILHHPHLATVCALWIGLAIATRWLAHCITMLQRVNRIPIVCRLIEPFTFYGIGLVYTYTFFVGLFRQRGAWHVVECKNIT
jgi:cellulose synthase/poly-beta-1,6-N-acetylglucosamine synthase-like glycosyltransferase